MLAPLPNKVSRQISYWGFWLLLLPGIRPPETKYRVYSAELCSVSIGNTQGDLNTFRNGHIILIRIHSCSGIGVV